MRRLGQRKERHSIKETGAALLSVIMILGLLSLLAVTVTVYVTSRSTINTLTREALHKRLLIESALAYAVGRVRSSPVGVPVSGEDRIRLTIGNARMSWIAESARLDLNLADPQHLITLLLGVGLRSEQAELLADQIVIRRSIPSDGRVQNPDKALAGVRVGPFEHTVELLTLTSMTNEIYERLEPFVTVYGSSNKIDPRLAPKTLISTLLPLSSVDLLRIEAGRQSSDEEMKTILTSIPEAFSLFDLQRPPATRLKISLQTAHGSQQAIELIFLTFDDDIFPYRILEWHEH